MVLHSSLLFIIVIISWKIRFRVHIIIFIIVYQLRLNETLADWPSVYEINERKNGGALMISNKRPKFNAYSIIFACKIALRLWKTRKTNKKMQWFEVELLFFSLFDCIHGISALRAICNCTIWWGSVRQHFGKLSQLNNKKGRKKTGNRTISKRSEWSMKNTRANVKFKKKRKKNNKHAILNQTKRKGLIRLPHNKRRHVVSENIEQK